MQFSYWSLLSQKNTSAEIIDIYIWQYKWQKYYLSIMQILPSKH